MPMLATVPVSLKERSYDILILPGILKEAGSRLTKAGVKGKVGVVTDRHVAELHLQSLL